MAPSSKLDTPNESQPVKHTSWNRIQTLVNRSVDRHHDSHQCEMTPEPLHRLNPFTLRFRSIAQKRLNRLNPLTHRFRSIAQKRQLELSTGSSFELPTKFGKKHFRLLSPVSVEPGNRILAYLGPCCGGHSCQGMCLSCGLKYKHIRPGFFPAK